MLMIMPPGWDFTQPYLALPQLKGYLNGLGLDISIVDDNVEFYDYILDDKFMRSRLESVQNRYAAMDSGKTVDSVSELNSLRRVNVYGSKIGSINEIKNTIKTTTDSELYYKCFHVISSCLEVLSRYYSMTILPECIESKIYNVKTITGLHEFINDREHNIFLDYYLDGKGKELVDRALNETQIGISITSKYQLISALTFLSILNKRQNRPTVHLGGSYLTRLSKAISDDVIRSLLEYCDFLSLYEGETILPSILTGTDYRDCPNVIYCDNGKIIRTEFRKYVPGSLTIPNFDGFSLNKYLSAKCVLPLVTTKGCYSRCAFCTVPLANSCNRYIEFSMEEIVGAVRSLEEKYHTKYFTFNDETFNLRRMVEFSRLVKDDGIKWLCETRFDENISDSEFEEIVASGCSYVEFGLESYNQRVLDLMHKNIKIADIDRIVNQCLKHRLPIHLFAFFGFPGETKEDIKNTQKYILDTIDRFHEAGVMKITTGFGAFELEKGSPVFCHPDTYKITIIPNENDSIDLEYQYTSDTALMRKELDEIVNSFTKTDCMSYPNFFYQSFILYSTVDEKNGCSPDAAEFTDYHDLNGSPAEFSYLYDFNTQRLIPFDSRDPMEKDELYRIYCLNEESELSKTDFVKINPQLIIGDMITDPIRNLQFNLPDVFRPIVDSFVKGEPVKSVPSDEDSLQLYNELYSASILIKTRPAEQQ